jgi:hypothetical protein
MPAIFSNQLKALLVVEDITEQGVNVWQDNCFTVQHFSYDCHRRRNDAGEPYGPTVPAYLDFTVKVASDNNGKVFFERMQQDETFPYSFLFNASFNSMRRLSECQDAMVVTGYIVEVEESYGEVSTEEGVEEQMLIHARLLVSNIAYLGQESILELTITKD